MKPLADQRVDRGQLSALLRLYRRLSLRGARDSVSGKAKGGPLLIIPSYLLFGGLLIPTLDASADPRTGMIMLATAILAMSALTLIPEALESQQARIEILSTKPIGERTQAVAQGLNSLKVLSLALLSLLAPGLWYLASAFQVSAPDLLLFTVLLIGAAFAFQTLWMAALLSSAAFFSYERIRSVAQVLLMSVLLTSWLPGFTFRTLRGGGAPVSFDGYPQLAWLPSAWVVDAPGPDAWPARGALLALLGLALTLRNYTTRRGYQRRLIEAILQPAAKPGGSSVALRLLNLWAWARLAQGPSLGVARLILIAIAREDHARLRRMSLRALLLLNVAVGVGLGMPLLTEVPTATIAAMLLATELDLVHDSQQAEASWLFLAAPLRPAELRAGTRLAILASFWSFTGPLLLLAFGPAERPALLLPLFLALAMGTLIFVSAVLRLRPRIPLSREPRGGFHLGTLFVSFLLALLAGLVYAGLQASPVVTLSLLGLLALAALRPGPQPRKAPIDGDPVRK